MDWKRILRIAAIASVVVLLFSICSACIRDKSKIVDWDDCSQEMGDHPCDFTLVDQHGEDFNLYDHYGKIIIIDFSAMWCGPCQFAATEVEELQKRYNKDIVYVTILIENGHGHPPTRNNVEDWAEIFHIETAPVLGASRNFLSSDPDKGWPLSAWPQFYIIDRDMVIIDSFKGSAPGRMESKIIDILNSESEEL
jgi:thiol-disulfide isomerase/thioredoxin